MTPPYFYSTRRSFQKKGEVLTKLRKTVTPAKAGNQKYMNLDSCFHRKPWIPAFGNDENGTKRTFYESINISK